MYRFPTTATAPFCPSEVRGSVFIDPGLALWRRMLRFAGPGLLISVGYMDPGNWATDIAAGSQFGYSLLFVVVLSSLAAILLQTLCLRLGIVAGKDLARASRERYRPAVSNAMWVFAEIAIIACDVAEVLGCALALKLLLGVPLPWGIVLTGLDTVIVLGLQGRGFRRLEAIVLGLIATIGICFLLQLILIGPDIGGILSGLVPRVAAFEDTDALYISIGILGATVMPHNLYLHSSIVQTRVSGESAPAKRNAIRLATLDTAGSLGLALLVNAAILILAAAAFHATGATTVTDIEDAYRLLEPIAGTAFASFLFGLALLASGQSSTFTGTIAGQVIMEGFLDLKIPCYQRRLITRTLALVPALIGVLTMGEHAVGRLLVFSQVVLSAQLPFAIFPLIRLTSDRRVMGAFTSPPLLAATAWILFLAITAANLWLLLQTVGLV
ncbi:MAG TPA: Nramp family divalent metal transporter [Hypericibacter adhaerens]|jgi:manganese transport protein|uniref:Divalent metal cation transporter MntH n=1 Tax=Hypericibacter adhaerens TaxID=2602016 RepID=A0A5J6N0P6_9PROT|nr:Nramp family divalent metal transporter [Hypericibacter adhaerens]QEX23037.1 divalent metal cation transporter MntH 1 [Hypericibacter adhaerens]HWA44231.1 Nramp family divalent metal transporter [Hypericibacter adhaerens]